MIHPAGSGAATIKVDCNYLHAKCALNVRQVFQLGGVVVERYDSRPVANATVTVTEGENAGKETYDGCDWTLQSCGRLRVHDAPFGTCDDSAALGLSHDPLFLRSENRSGSL